MNKCIILFITILFSTVVYSQQAYQDVIHLKNGDIAKGVIIENVPNDYVKLETSNGSIITFIYIDISKFTKEKFTNEVQKQQENIQQFPTNPTSHSLQSSKIKTTQRIEFIPYNSISFGYGNSFGGFGAKFEYKFGTVAIHGGAGYFPAPIDYAESTVLFSGGIKFFLTNKELYLNLQFGTLGVEATQLSYSTYYSTTKEVTQETLYGPSILLGNTIWFSSSIGLNGAFGASYNMVDIEWTDELKYLFAGDLGLTIKF